MGQSKTDRHIKEKLRAMSHREVPSGIIENLEIRKISQTTVSPWKEVCDGVGALDANSHLKQMYNKGTQMGQWPYRRTPSEALRISDHRSSVWEVLLENLCKEFSVRCCRDYALGIDAGVVLDRLCSVTKEMLRKRRRLEQRQYAVAE